MSICDCLAQCITRGVNQSQWNPTHVPCVKSDIEKGADLKLDSGREGLIKAQKSDTG